LSRYSRSHQRFLETCWLSHCGSSSGFRCSTFVAGVMRQSHCPHLRNGAQLEFRLRQSQPTSRPSAAKHCVADSARGCVVVDEALFRSSPTLRLALLERCGQKQRQSPLLSPRRCLRSIDVRDQDVIAQTAFIEINRSPSDGLGRVMHPAATVEIVFAPMCAAPHCPKLRTPPVGVRWTRAVRTGMRTFKGGIGPRRVWTITSSLGELKRCVECGKPLLFVVSSMTHL
jgi:hypothetical protein